MTKEELQDMAHRIMAIDHMGIQCDDIHQCEYKHQIILQLDKMDRYEAVRLVMHVMHVQQLQLEGAVIEYDKDNPFRGMVDFDCIDTYVKSNSPTMDSLY